MQRKALRPLSLLLAATLLFIAPIRHALATPPFPNVVLILADDLGYGDTSAYNREAKVETRNIDLLARQGMKFTDAHGAATCIPSRYQLMTGRYLFRSRGETPGTALIEPGRVTLATVMKQAGYATSMIGKWHLGFEGLGIASTPFDYAQRLRGGPLDHGFDSYFGIHASLDVPPYFFIQDDLATANPIAEIAEHHSPDVRPIQGEFWRAGTIASNFKHDQVLPRLIEHAVKYISSRSRTKQPFFLYLALTAPHAPWLPTREFQNKSGAGAYGDFLIQVDDAVGQVIDAIDRSGKRDDTLIIFTSDNGPLWFDSDVQRYGHRAAGPWRGKKADAWEGGHRIPFIACWPRKIPAGTTRTQLISFTDLLRTFSNITSQMLPNGAGEDSVDLLPILLAKTLQPVRETIVYEVTGPSVRSFSIRIANWKLIPWSPTEATPQEPHDLYRITKAGQLYNLSNDPSESHNVYSAHPKIVQKLQERLTRILQDAKQPSAE